MDAKKFQDILEIQLRLAAELYSESTSYANLYKYYARLYDMGVVTKHHTYDSTFFIHDDGATGFSVIKFYNGGVDYRTASRYESAAVAYSEALAYL